MGRKGIITLSGKVAMIKRLLRLCNGITKLHDIKNQMPLVDPEEISELLTLCEAYGIVRDSRELYIGFHEDSTNPAIFSHDLGNDDVASIVESKRLRERDGKIIQLPKFDNSTVLSAIRKRQSVRQFQDAQ